MKWPFVLFVIFQLLKILIISGIINVGYLKNFQGGNVVKKMKKHIALLIALILTVGTIPSNVFTTRVQAASTITGYYGKQLTQDQKNYYKIFEEKYLDANHMPKVFDGQFSVDSPDTTVYASKEAMEEAANIQAKAVNYAYVAFIRDYPQVFWTKGIGVGYSYGSYSDGSHFLISIKIEVKNAMEVTDAMLITYKAGIAESVEEIIGNLDSSAEIYDYYKEIHDWVCENVTYNSSAVSNSSAYPEAYTSYPVFASDVDASVVCEGYGESYKILCDQIKQQKNVDLECVLITGSGVSDKGTEAHLWNSVRMPDDNWYGVDTTWDDQTTIRYNYFLCGKKSVGFHGMIYENDHVENTQVSSGVSLSYPTVANYEYGASNAFNWSYDSGTLIITGTGELPEYLAGTGAPWYDYRNEITTIEIENGITRLPEGMLSNYQNVKQLRIPYVGLSQDAIDDQAVLGILFGKVGNGVIQFHKLEDGQFEGFSYAIPQSLEKVTVTDANKISFGAFYNCSNLKYLILNEGIQNIQQYSVYNCSSLVELVIPNSVTSIEEYALCGCNSLQNLTIPFIGARMDANDSYDAPLGYIFGGGDNTDTPQYCLSTGNGYCYQIPTTLKQVTVTKDPSIPIGAFSSCTSIVQIQLSADTQSIYMNAFYGCSGLQRITFKGDAPGIDGNAFYGCGILTAYTPAGNSTWTTAKQKNYGATQIVWDDQNTVDSVAKIASAKISLQDNIAVKFYVTLDDSVTGDDYLKVKVNGRESTIKVREATKTVSSLTGEERYVFVCKVTSKEMTKNITAQMVVGDLQGTAVSYSVKKYATAVLNMADGLYENEKTLIRAMLNYGGYAQKYFLTEEELQSEILANQNLYTPDTDPVVKTTSFDLNQYEPTGYNINKLEVSLLLKSETELRIYFIPENGKTIDDYIVTLSGTDKASQTGTVEGKCYISIPGIQATELGDVYTITITQKDGGAVFASATCGAFSYAKKVLEDSSQSNELQNLMKALYLYHKAALAYAN